MRIQLALALPLLVGLSSRTLVDAPEVPDKLQVQFNLIVDFPSADATKYPDVSPARIVRAMRHAQGRLNPAEVREKHFLAAIEYPTATRLPSYKSVRHGAEMALDAYRLHPDTVEFAPITPDEFIEQLINDTTNELSPEQRKEAKERMKEFYAEFPLSDPVYARFPVDEDLSCVRWKWVDGELVVEYNYALVVCDSSDGPTLEKLAPRYSLLAHFTVPEAIVGRIFPGAL